MSEPSVPPPSTSAETGSDTQPKRVAQIGLVTLLLVGCLAVLWPFIGAILFAAVVCVASWHPFARLCAGCGGRRTLAALLMTLLLVLVVLLPMGLLSGSLANGVEILVTKARPLLDQGLPHEAPAWLRNLPLVGGEIDAYWKKIADSRDELNKLGRMLLDPARQALLATVKLAGQGLLQLALVIFIAFFFYRDGEALAAMARTGATRLGGPLGARMLGLARSTVVGVMIGIVGTAVAQALVALLGFLIAGAPAPMLLAFATFFLSMIPVGPPLIWGGAAWWLYDQGETGWAAFLVIWGVLVISSVDNFVKPLLISKSASLPILLIALGVFGGVLVFGFIGIFLGPTLLALGHVLLAHWTAGDPLVEPAP